jgi:ribose transport system ATP-binding protein
MTAPGDVILRADGLGKRFGSVTVLSDITLEIRAGEVHAIIGENGAGKSTLMRLLAGYIKPTAGTLSIDGQPVAFESSNAAQAAGIALVHQEILLAEDLTVAENIFLGREIVRHGIVDDRMMNRAVAEKLAELGCGVDPRAEVRKISLADRQLVQIARALLDSHRVVIFDEPTAVLTHEEVDMLLGIIRRLKEQGVAVLYISHRLDEVEQIADRITVLRDGKMVGSHPGRTLSQIEMARLMVGRALAAFYPERSKSKTAEPLLEIEAANVPGRARDVSFTAHRGEILGFAGMIGAGRTELFEGLLGLRSATVASMRLAGRAIEIRGPRQALDAGIAYMTEDRKGKGLLLQEQLAPNLTLASLKRFHPGLLVDQRKEADALTDAIERYDIRVGSRDVRAGQLSGGNQQKVLLAKIMLTDPSVVIIDEPTRGIDIANKSQIYGFIQKFVRQGKACIVISSEMQELIGICDRILVMRGGRITGELAGETMTESNIALLATSHGAAAQAAAQ